MPTTSNTPRSTKAAASSEAVKQITYLATALKAPRITEAAARLADQARDAGWTHEDYLAAVLEREVCARNVVLLGPPGTGKTHLATALGVAAARHGHRVLFATATEWVTRLSDAHRAGRLPHELAKLRRYGLIIRRGRLSALRTRRRKPVLPTRLIPL